MNAEQFVDGLIDQLFAAAESALPGGGFQLALERAALERVKELIEKTAVPAAVEWVKSKGINLP